MWPFKFFERKSASLETFLVIKKKTLSFAFFFSASVFLILQNGQLSRQTDQHESRRF